MNQFENVLIVGLGNMAGAMLDGWLASGLEAQRFTAVDPARESAPDGVTLLRELPQDGAFDCIVLGVKPQMLGDVAVELERLAGPHTTVISILAGTQIAALKGYFPRAHAIVRIMPNLAASLGKSATTLFAQDADDATSARTDELVRRLGTAEWLESEDQFHAVTALAGSGPGFVYRLLETLAKAGEELGIPPEQAERLVKQMVDGAGSLAALSKESPAKLASRVASPGGTTQAGLDVLDDNDALARLIEACLRAARDRSVEMSEYSRKNG